MSSPSMVNAGRFTDRDLIESVVTSFFIIDYGFITAVNSDGTVNVTHAKILKNLYGESLPVTKTSNIEVLTISGAGFSIKPDIKKGDKVLLLGLKDYVESVDDVTQPTETKVFMHYSRNTMKALPLCVFNSDAKVKIEIDSGDLNITTSGDVNIKCSKANIQATSFKVTNSGGVAALEVTP